jgi:hypothetical protein
LKFGENSPVKRNTGTPDSRVSLGSHWLQGIALITGVEDFLFAKTWKVEVHELL